MADLDLTEPEVVVAADQPEAVVEVLDREEQEKEAAASGLPEVLVVVEAEVAYPATVKAVADPQEEVVTVCPKKSKEELAAEVLVPSEAVAAAEEEDMELDPAAEM